jgi:hypothetical protein
MSLYTAAQRSNAIVSIQLHIALVWWSSAALFKVQQLLDCKANITECSLHFATPFLHCVIQSLSSMAPSMATALRDGAATQVPATDICRGDIVMMHAGDKVIPLYILVYYHHALYDMSVRAACHSISSFAQSCVSKESCMGLHYSNSNRSLR